MHQSVRTTLVVLCIALAMFGVVVPAFAGSRDGTMTNWHDGDRSSSWSDGNLSSSVVFYTKCKHDFDARIMHEYTGLPDKKTGSERINCTQYNDAVRSTGTASGKYHFDVHEYDLAGSYIVYPNLSGRYTVKW